VPSHTKAKNIVVLLAMKALVTHSGEFSLVSTLSSGSDFISMTPSICQRLANIGASFEYYRFTDFKVQVGCGSTSTNTGPTNLVVGFHNEQIAGSGPTWAQQSELGPTVHYAPQTTVGLQQTVPSPFLNIPKKRLMATPTKWWKYTYESTSPNDQQGTLGVVSDYTSDAGKIYLHCKYTCEFTGFAEQGDALPRSRMATQECKQREVVEIGGPPVLVRNSGLSKLEELISPAPSPTASVRSCIVRNQLRTRLG